MNTNLSISDCLIWLLCIIKWAVILIVSLFVNRNLSFSKLFMYWKSLFVSLILRNRVLRCSFNPLHIVRKCISSSIFFGQRGQKRNSFSIFIYLPFSIMSWWFDNRNLDRATLSFSHGMRFR